MKTLTRRGMFPMIGVVEHKAGEHCNGGGPILAPGRDFPGGGQYRPGAVLDPTGWIERSILLACLRPPERMSAKFLTSQADCRHPLVDEARVLTGAEVVGMIDAAREDVICTHATTRFEPCIRVWWRRSASIPNQLAGLAKPDAGARNPPFARHFRSGCQLGKARRWCWRPVHAAPTRP